MARKRILFIDSDDGFVQAVASSLERSGFDYVLSSSSTEGVERARQDHPDLIVVNVELAPTNGWSVCTKLKKDDDLKSIPIVLTSSTSTEDTFEKHKKLKTRADEYLLKPYVTSDLIRVAGSLVGMPDMPAEQEDLVIEDETLASGDFDMTGLDEEIPVVDDEPIEGGVIVGEDLNGADGTEVVAEEPAVFAAASDEESVAVEDVESVAVAEGEELDPLSAAADPAAEQAAPAGSEDDLIAFDESFANLSTGRPDTGTDEGFVDLNDEQLAATGDEQGGDPLAEGTFNDDIAFDEAPLDPLLDAPLDAPLEAPAEAAAEGASDAGLDAPLEAAPEAYQELGEFPADGFGTEGEAGLDASAELPAAEASVPDAEIVGVASAPPGLRAQQADDSMHAVLEARVAELESEIEGYRATENNRDQELERLRTETTQKDRDLEDLRSQLLGRDKSIRELKDTESRSNAELSKGRDEKTRREAAMKALTLKAEQISAAARKWEREAGTARDDAKGIPALNARIGELEQSQQASAAALTSLRTELEGERDALRTQLEGERETLRGEMQAQLESVRTQLQTELDGARSELETTRHSHEALTGEHTRISTDLEATRQDLTGTQQQLEAAQQSAQQAKAEADQARQEAQQAKDTLDAARGEAALAHDDATQAREESARLRTETEQAREQQRTATEDATKASEESAKAQEEAARARAETTQARVDATQARGETAQVKQQVEESARALETSRTEAETLRKQVEQLQTASANDQTEIGNLRTQLASAEERIKLLSEQSEAATTRATRAREALRAAVEHLGQTPQS